MASAHGDLLSLLKNPELNALVGGTTSVTLGDRLAQATNGGNKVKHGNGKLRQFLLASNLRNYSRVFQESVFSMGMLY